MSLGNIRLSSLMEELTNPTTHLKYASQLLDKNIGKISDSNPAVVVIHFGVGRILERFPHWVGV